MRLSPSKRERPGWMDVPAFRRPDHACFKAGELMDWEDDLADDRVSLAVENNAEWCDLVCRSRGIPTSWQTGFWVSRQPTISTQTG